MDTDQFLALIRDVNNDPNKYDLNKVLYDFQHKINANIFYQLSKNNNLLEIFKLIWKFLIESSSNPSSTIRIASCKSIGTFLTWIAPFFPELMRNSFVDVVRPMKATTKNSAVISSSFAFISTFIAEPFLPEFLKSIPIFQYFVLNDTYFSEHVAIVLSNLHFLGSEWLKTLLNLFLKQIEENQDRILIRKIAAIIDKDPNLYLQIVLDFVKPQIHKYMSLLTFLITAYQKDISATIDLMPVACAAIDTINDEKASLGDFDSALQILSIKSNSFQFSASDNNTNCNLKIWNESNLEKQATIDLTKVISMPSFYLLDLPITLLKPNPEKDSILVIGAKFKSIALNPSFDVNEVFSIFEPFLQAEYNDMSSSAIQAFSSCINRVMATIPQQKFHAIIRKILFSKPLNWYHSFDILKVINNIDSQLFMKKMGEKCFIELLEVLISFCLCENESLATDSMKSLSDQTYHNKQNLEKVISVIINKCDFFELLKLDRCVSTLTSILTRFSFKNYKNENLTFFSQKLIEALPMFWNNVNFLCHVFNFFTAFKISHDKNKTIINAAYCTIFSTIEIISGRTVAYKIRIDNSDYFKNLIKKDLSSRSVDIIAEPSNDHKSFIYPMKCALFFIFANAPTNEAVAAAMISHKLFPLECSQFYEMSWKGAMREEEKEEVVANILSVLKFVGDQRIHATWCRILLLVEKDSKVAAMSEFNEIEAFLVQMSSYFMNNFEEARVVDEIEDGVVEICASYIEYLHAREGERSIEAISDFLNRIDQVCLNGIVEANQAVLEIVPSIKEKVEVAAVKRELNDVEQLNEIEKTPIKLSEKVDDDQLRRFFEESIRNSNVQLLKEAIQIMADRKMTIKLEDFKIEFPPETIPIVAGFLAHNLAFDDQQIDLLRTLRGIRTPWRPYSIEFFKKPPNSAKLLDFLIVSEKVKKNDILCLCALIGEVYFDNRLLFKLSTKLLFESAKFNRFRVTLKLLATVLTVQPTVPQSFLSALVTTLSPLIEKVDVDGLSIVLLIIAQKVGFPIELVKFASTDAVFNPSVKSPALFRIAQVFVGVSSSFQLAAQKINDTFSSLTFAALKSLLPSRFNGGCRLLEQVSLSIKTPSILPFIGRGVEMIVERFGAFSSFQSSVNAMARALCAFVGRSGAAQQHLVLFRVLNKAAPSSSSDACFITFVGVLLAALKSSSDSIEIMKRFPDSFFDSIFNQSGYGNGNPFKYARLCLVERLRRIKSVKDSEKLIKKSIDVWKTSLPSYAAMLQVIEWWNLIECHFSVDKAFEIFDALLVDVIKSAGFGAGFPALLRLFVGNREKCKDCKEFVKLLDDVSGVLQKKSHIEAFNEMKNLPEKIEDKEKEKCKELMKMAFSENE